MKPILNFIDKYGAIAALVLLLIFFLINTGFYIANDHSTPVRDIAMHLYKLQKYYRAGPAFLVQNEYPPFIYVVSGIFLKIFGYSPSSALLSLLPFAFLYILSLYGLGSLAFGREGGVVSAFLGGAGLYFIEYCHHYYIDVPSASLMLAALYLLFRSDGFRNVKFSIAAGVVTGLAFLTKWTSIPVLVPALAAYVLMSVVSEKVREKKNVIRNALFAFLIPVVMAAPWYVQAWPVIVQKTKAHTLDYNFSSSFILADAFSKLRIALTIVNNSFPSIWLLFITGAVILILTGRKKAGESGGETKEDTTYGIIIPVFLTAAFMELLMVMTILPPFPRYLLLFTAFVAFIGGAVNLLQNRVKRYILALVIILGLSSLLMPVVEGYGRRAFNEVYILPQRFIIDLRPTSSTPPFSGSGNLYEVMKDGCAFIDKKNRGVNYRVFLFVDDEHLIERSPMTPAGIGLTTVQVVTEFTGRDDLEFVSKEWDFPIIEPEKGPTFHLHRYIRPEAPGEIVNLLNERGRALILGRYTLKGKEKIALIYFESSSGAISP